MSDNLSGRWNRILMSKDISDDVVIERSNYDDFSTSSPWRNFELLVEKRIFYVNPGWLAELSPYFAKTIFGREPVCKRIVIDDVTPEETLEFLRCITFCPMRKPLSVRNVSTVLKFAKRYEMRPVQARCEHFISCNAQSLDKNKLFQVTCALSQCDPNSSTMTVLVDKLAAIDDKDLSRCHFANMPGDVVAEVYEQRLKTMKRSSSGGNSCCLVAGLRSIFKKRPNHHHHE